MNQSLFDIILGIGTLILLLKSVYILFHLLAPKKIPIPAFAKKYYLFGVTLLAFLGMVGSLVYSEIIGFPPCTLCWYQRIAIYGVAIVGITALVKRYTKEVVDYIRILSGLGLIIAIFHIIQEKTGVSVLCSADGAVSCSKQLVFSLGFISIPVMSLSILLLIFLVTFLMKKELK